MPRSFNTPYNKSKRKKIISATIILLISAILIVYQLVKTRNEAEVSQDRVVNISNISNDQEESIESMTIESLYNEITNQNFILSEQNKKIESLEKKIKKLENEIQREEEGSEEEESLSQNQTIIDENSNDQNP